MDLDPMYGANDEKLRLLMDKGIVLLYQSGNKLEASAIAEWARRMDNGFDALNGTIRALESR